MFFAILYVPDTDSALPSLNFLDLLNVKNIHKLQLLLNSLINGLQKNFDVSLASIFATQVKSIHIIRDMLQKLTSSKHVSGLT